ncbi:MAG: three-Cys-motif partner protein TcmP [Bacteroidota bacterium]
MHKQEFDPNIHAQEDGFVTPVTESWTLQKNHLTCNYIRTILDSSRERYDDLIYIDLFAGSGFNQLNDQVILGSPLVALSSPFPFTKYIFCEKNHEHAAALKIRINKYFRNENVVIFAEDANNAVDKFRFYVPTQTPKRKVLAICLVDPFSFDLHFSSIQKMAELGITLLTVMAFPINSYFNHSYYLEQKRGDLEAFIGNGDTNQRSWEQIKGNEAFFKQVIKSYKGAIESLGYKTSGAFNKIESDLMQLPFYYFASFTQQKSIKNIDQAVKKASAVQYQLFQN